MIFQSKNIILGFFYILFWLCLRTWANEWEYSTSIEHADAAMFANLFGALWFSSLFKLKLSITPILYLIAFFYDIIVHGIIGQLFHNLDFSGEVPFELSLLSISIHLLAPLVFILPVILNYFGSKVVVRLKLV